MSRDNNDAVDSTTATSPRDRSANRSVTVAGIAFGLVIVVLLGLGVLAWQLSRDGSDTAGKPAKDTSLLEVTPEYVAAVVGKYRVPNGSGEFLTDGVRARAWTAEWTEDLAVKPCSDRDAEVPGVEIDLRDPLSSKPRALREYAIEPGLSANDPGRTQEWLPKTLELWWTVDGKTVCTPVELPDTPGQVRFPAPAGNVGYVTVRVAQVYPAPAGVTPKQVSLGEVMFWKR